MDPLYKPQGVEQRWQQTWEAEGFYGAGPDAPGETFVVMHPPPNISGSLTIGHCLQLSLEDTLVRWHRMRGFNTLFQPGYDHAGISTWAAIGRTLAQEGRSQRDLGRDGFDAYAQERLKHFRGPPIGPVTSHAAPRLPPGQRASLDHRHHTAPI